MKPTVLIVDDEQGLPELMAKVLARDGIAAILANSLREARLHPGPFAAVIADIRLPNGDGRDLRGDYPDIPFVVITGHLDKSMAASEPFFLPKPFSPFQLREKVRQALGRP